MISQHKEAILLLAVCEAGYKSCGSGTSLFCLKSSPSLEDRHQGAARQPVVPESGGRVPTPPGTNWHRRPGWGLSFWNPSALASSQTRWRWIHPLPACFQRSGWCGDSMQRQPPHTPQLGSCIAEKCLTMIRGKRATIRTP